MHEPAADCGPDNASEYKKNIGTIIFFLYASVYFGFVIINVWKPLLMEKTIFLGLNLAVVYGFGLIIFALILALIYNFLCGIKEKKLNVNQDQGGK